MSKVDGGEQRFHFLKMTGKPQVIVFQVNHVSPARIRQRRVPMRFAKSLAFWKTETSDPSIEPFLGKRVIDGLLWGAIGNDQHLESLDGLSSHALQCERQIDRRPDEWEQNGEA